MSELEKVSLEFETLRSSLEEAKQLQEQFPADWTLRMHIAKAEYRMESLQSMMTAQPAYQYGRV
jgi:predicted house-cleaning NTP pyrophosphatase (Maf/HAM1 superfamily)